MDLESNTQIINLAHLKNVLSLRKCQLMVIEGPDKDRQIELSNQSIKIGKKEDNQFILKDITVSRHHLSIEPTGDSFILRDLDSTNGTFINGMKIKEAYLSPGDVISLGNTKIEFLSYNEKVHIEPSARESLGNMVGKSRKMRQVFGICEKIAPTQATVIIEGETGTGKDLVARAIHENSPRKDKPFIVFDCSAVAPNLIESELFGHEKGSFTGAIKERKGAFESANGGTLFLDEIGELSLELQPKLLRALEQREIRRVGSNLPTKIDVRVICATNRSLAKEVQEARFRQDLYYRLSVVKINLPSLRERVEDIPIIIHKFLSEGKFNQNLDGSLKVTRVEDDALKALKRYNWPGNVRELANIVERTVSMAEGSSIEARHLADLHNISEQQIYDGEKFYIDFNLPFKEAKQKIVEVFEKDYLEELLKRNDYNISKTARHTDIDRKHLRNLIKKYGLMEVKEEEE